MNRTPLKLAMVILAYLAAGAVVNQLVAAGCALWAPITEPYERHSSTVPKGLTKWIPQQWIEDQQARAKRDGDPDRLIFFGEHRRTGVVIFELTTGVSVIGRAFYGTHTPLPQLDAPHRVVIVRAGWPLRCFEAACDSSLPQWSFDLILSPAPAPITGFKPVATIPWNDRHSTEVQTPTATGLPGSINRNFIPLSPVWPALIANMIVWALILVLLVHGPRLVRGEIRMRRGLCRSCGYPIGVSDRCTECGRELPGWVLKLQETVPPERP